MTKRNTKKALLLSFLSLLLCCSMLVGTTFAWFTDSVTSGKNKIIAGNLDVGLQYFDGTDWVDVKADTNVFEEDTLWEPGHTEVVYLRVSNLGTLALKYQLGINIAKETASVNMAGERFQLSEHIEFAAIEGVQTPYADRDTARKAVTRSDVLASGYTKQGVMEPGVEPQYVALVVFMPEEVGNEANYMTGYAAPEILLGIDLFATQYTYESDSFDNQYDITTEMPDFVGKYSIPADVGTLDASNQTTDAIAISAPTADISAEIPAGVAVTEGTTQLTLEVEKTERSSNITLAAEQVSLSLDVHIDGLDENNTVPVTVNLGAVLPAGLKASSIQLYHVEEGTPILMTAVDTFTAHNQYIYNDETGELSIHIASFSEITMLVTPNDPWNGNADVDWYNDEDVEFTLSTEEQLAGLGQLVARGNDFDGKTIILGSNLNLGSSSGKTFLPIGYDPTYSMDVIGAFKGTFDGNNKVVRNLHQDTWSIKGNYSGNYYNESMGLFAFIDGGTVKNLNLYRFDMQGEFAPMGCVAGYANGGTFDNIRLIECEPYTYNTGVGGIIGWDVGETADVKYVFNNINIDSTNTVGALWGTYDAGCGGIMGYLSETSYANFTNCSIGCVLDVFNDVCGNYQYYQYRYSGMVIGTVGMDTEADLGKIKIGENVNVFYNDWVHYFYCEFTENTQASYTHDYQFSRVPHSELIFTDSNGNGRIDTEEEAESVTGCTHDHASKGTEIVNGVEVQVEDKQAVYLPFKQMISGYGWGADHGDIGNVGTKDYDYKITYMDATEVLLVEYKTNEVEYQIPYTATLANAEFERWVNAGGQVVSTIPSGHTENVTLYTDWKNEYVARFLDQQGNVIAEIPFDSDTGKFKENAVEPSVPAVEGLEIVGWEEYTLKGEKTDVAIKPVYKCNEYVQLTPVDTDGDGTTDYYQVTGSTITADNVDVVIPSVVNGIEVQYVVSGAFASGDLRDVYVPGTVNHIGKNAFTKDGSEFPQIQIIFDGTKEQWESIQKDDGWDDNIGTGSVIVCTQENPIGYYKQNGSNGLFGWGASVEWEWQTGAPDWYPRSTN